MTGFVKIEFKGAVSEDEYSDPEVARKVYQKCVADCLLLHMSINYVRIFDDAEKVSFSFDGDDLLVGYRMVNLDDDDNEIS